MLFALTLCHLLRTFPFPPTSTGKEAFDDWHFYFSVVVVVFLIFLFGVVWVMNKDDVCFLFLDLIAFILGIRE